MRLIRCDVCRSEAPAKPAPQGWTFHDGKDVCSDDCLFSLRSIAQLKDGREVRITRHALARFEERSGYLGQKTSRALGTLRGHLKSAVPDEVEAAHRTRRLISNGFEAAEYLKCGVWRFVIVGDEVRTVETRNGHNW